MGLNMKIFDYGLVSNYEKIHVAIRSITDIIDGEHFAPLELKDLADVLEKLICMSLTISVHIKIDE